MKELFLLRGLPGAGKSTLAKSLNEVYFEADQYFIEFHEYKFDPTKLKYAHSWCQLRTEHAMEDESPRIVVSNTFTQEWEMEKYYKLAEKYGYRVYSLIIENRHDGINEHNVPSDKIEQMRNRFEVKL
jgi:predicted kinase